MKRFERSVIAGALMAVWMSGVAMAADQDQKSASETPRPRSRPSMLKNLRSNVKAYAQEQIRMYKYMRGVGSPEF